MPRRQISEPDQQQVVARQGLKCFVDGHPVTDASDFEFDHIIPFAEGGASEVANIGAVCKKHNREKGTLSLSEYRDRLHLRQFFEGAKKRRLDDLLQQRLGSGKWGQPLSTEPSDGQIAMFLPSGRIALPLSDCPATGERYFFATLPVSLLANDVELQPRALEPDRVWELYRHLRTHTQLAPAVCRLVGDKLKLFDGQHKAAAQVWAGRQATGQDHVTTRVINTLLRRLRDDSWAIDGSACVSRPGPRLGRRYNLPRQRARSSSGRLIDCVWRMVA